jgi:uncharacterized integral membrane protein (TIGR00697 family)
MLYLTADLLSLVFTYKFIQFGSVFFSAEALIFPITYTITDIIAEVYGYSEARKTIWLVFLFDFIFALGAYLLTLVPSPDLHTQLTYNEVFKSLLRGTVAEVFGVLSGIFINIYAITKLKIFTKGKYFWLRSIGSSLIGEFILVIVSMPIMFSGVVSGTNLTKIIFYTYTYKIIFAFMAAIPATFIVLTLKRKENIDIYDNNIKFNPFIFSDTK